MKIYIFFKLDTLNNSRTNGFHFQSTSEKSLKSEPVKTVDHLADDVVRTLLKRYPDITIMIANRAGRCLTSTLPQKTALENSSCILNFTDKAKILTKKMLDEEITHVRIKGRKSEIIIMFNDLLEIITIHESEDQ